MPPRVCIATSQPPRRSERDGRSGKRATEARGADDRQTEKGNNTLAAILTAPYANPGHPVCSTRAGEQPAARRRSLLRHKLRLSRAQKRSAHATRYMFSHRRALADARAPRPSRARKKPAVYIYAARVPCSHAARGRIVRHRSAGTFRRRFTGWRSIDNGRRERPR